MTFPDQPGRSASLLEWALWNAAVGQLTGAFKVFPCWSGEKHPLHTGWQQEASWDKLTVETMWLNSPKANIGLAVAEGHVVIDADLYKSGKEALLDAYEAKHGELPRTLEFRSARGGIHLIYKTERALGNGTGSLPNFGDVRGHGGLVVGPGSYFEGMRYGVDHLASPVALPAHVDACLIEKAIRDPKGRELPEFVSLDDNQNVERFVTWLKKDAAISVEGQGGNNILAATGAMASSYAISVDVMLECLQEHWNSRCEPPWDDADLERHGGSGYRSASSSFGNMASKDPRLMFPPQPGNSGSSDQPFTGWGAPVWKLGDLLARGPPAPRQWALGTDNDGWMPLNDLTLLYGPGGAGKTTLVGQMARCFADGVPLFGNVPLRPMQVLYVGCEDDMDELHRRFAAQGAIENAHNVNLVSLIGQDTALHPAFKWGITDDSEQTAFYQFLEHHLTAMGEGDKLLILDNLGQMFFGDYQDRAEIGVFINRYVRRLLIDHGATGLLLAHPSASQVQSGEGGAGSPAWSANVRSHLFLDWLRDGKNGEAGRPVDGTRVFSRKKANYSRVHQPGDGVFLERKDDWTFSVMEKPKPPETPKAKRTREGDTVDTYFVSRKALTDLLEGMQGRLWPSDVAMSRALAAFMGKQGQSIDEETLRRHLKKHRESGFAHYHIDRGWQCQAKISNNVQPGG